MLYEMIAVVSALAEYIWPCNADFAQVRILKPSHNTKEVKE